MAARGAPSPLPPQHREAASSTRALVLGPGDVQGKPEVLAAKAFCSDANRLLQAFL